MLCFSECQQPNSAGFTAGVSTSKKTHFPIHGNAEMVVVPKWPLMGVLHFVVKTKLQN